MDPESPRFSSASGVYTGTDSRLTNFESSRTERDPERHAAVTQERRDRYQVGDTIGGRYEVFDVHRGGMGVVYGTLDRVSQLPRALKTLQLRYASNKRMRELFEAEALTWVKLEKHPSIVRAYLVKNFDGQPYVISEYIRGNSRFGSDLYGWLGNPQLTLSISVAIALQIAQGMEHAVGKVADLIHRDLKPANILIEESAPGGGVRAMVTDFGLTGAVELGAGTPAYMAPEQWRAESLDLRADIYAFGCIHYEMFARHPMYSVRSAQELRAAHLTQMPIDPQVRNAHLPAHIAVFILRCLSKSRKDRPGTWKDVVAECTSWFIQIHQRLPQVELSDDALTRSELFAAIGSLGAIRKYAEMLNVCERVIALNENDASGHNQKGNALNKLKRFEEALAAHNRAIAIDCRESAYWSGKGNALHNLVRLDEALLAFDQALSLDSTEMTVWNNKAIVLRAMARGEDAVKAYDRALSLDATNASVWTNKGAVLLDLNRDQDALLSFDRALAIEPNKLLAWEGRGAALRKLHKNEDALAAYDQAAFLDQDSLRGWEVRGQILQELKRFDQADVLYGKVLAARSSDSQAWFQKGHVLLRMERYEGALAAYGRASALDTNGGVSYIKGYVLLKLGRFKDAISACDKALAINPQLVAAQKTREIAMRALRGGQ